MMKQYIEAKKICPEALLLFRMGDFYEMFLEDAKIAAQVLGLALTSREKGPNAMPMAGFPHHQLDAYIAKLIAAGYRAAVCEQMEDPKKAKGIVKREVTRIVTAGTLTEETLLNPKKSNFLAAVCQDSRTPNFEIGLAWVELSTGEFFSTTVPGKQLGEQLARILPSEIIYSDKETFDCPTFFKVQLTKRPDWTFGHRTALDLLLKQFGTTTLEGFGFSNNKPFDVPAIRAAGAILSYLNETQRQVSVQIDSITAYRPESQLEIDETSRRSLEITTTIRGGNREGSLLSVMDRCITSMGSRFIADSISSPLTNIATINARLDAVEELYCDDAAVREIREQLRHIHDLQRILTRILQNRGTPRDLAMIARTLQTLPFFMMKLEKVSSPMLKSILENIDPCEQLAELLSVALKEDASANYKEGGFIRSGFNKELDELRNLQSGGKDWIAQYQAEEINRTGIPSLKVGYTRVFGYYIEITNAHREKVPGDYVRKMTIKNAERYITPQLKEYEEKILTSGERANNLEIELFEMLCKKTCEKRHAMQLTARALAALDVIASLALIARERGYCRPKLIEEPIMNIIDGRHPVLEALEPAGTFVPNDTMFDDEHGQIQLITGPNMAGKSTFIRQTALLCVMAQIGSFLPAREATIGICDRIFARVGASDEISRGQSTFMVEMTETARILNQATPRSLVVLDEVGRGTSTYDGISLAWAIVEYLHDKIGCRTLFATHYHELTDLSETFENIRNLNVAVKEQNDDIAFLHKIIPGAADKSYGIYVAKIAGIPKNVVKRAREILDELEQTHVEATAHSTNHPESEMFKNIRRKTVNSIQFSLFGSENHPVIEELRELDIDNLKPLDALQLVAKWKEITRNRELSK
ncbi:MAG: DNA mismatch repair protein MutS [Planctomycetaceae bacterium]|jgi:DNA mismatch repair protein MutS|nr:DNA mismatch repair protein MutS [Planctomycetaceae bacterium]